MDTDHSSPGSTPRPSRARSSCATPRPARSSARGGRRTPTAPRSTRRTGGRPGRRRAAGGLLEGVSALAVGGQQHGMVLLDEAGDVVRPALLWNDTRSAGAAADLVDELAGPGAWAEATGVVPVASITVSKLRWFARARARASAGPGPCVLPHDWLTGACSRSGGERSGGRRTAATRPAPATGPRASGDYRLDLLHPAYGRRPRRCRGWRRRPRPAGDGIRHRRGRAPATTWGRPSGWAEPGDVVVSLGTSGTAFARHDRAVGRPHRGGAVVRRRRGRLPAARLHAQRRPGAHRRRRDARHRPRRARPPGPRRRRPGAGGLALLPYLDGERTPDLPDATGSLGGLTRANTTPENLARAAVEGCCCGLAAAVDACGTSAPGAAGAAHRRASASQAVRRSRPTCSARPSPSRPRVSTSPSGRPARRRGRWPVASRSPGWDVEVDVTVAARPASTGPRRCASGMPPRRRGLTPPPADPSPNFPARSRNPQVSTTSVRCEPEGSGAEDLRVRAPAGCAASRNRP